MDVEGSKNNIKMDVASVIKNINDLEMSPQENKDMTKLNILSAPHSKMINDSKSEEPLIEDDKVTRKVLKHPSEIKKTPLRKNNTSPVLINEQKSTANLMEVETVIDK